MVPELSLILAFIASALLLAAVPGPDVVYVAMRGLAQGRRAGLVAALGLITGIFVHILLAALGLSAILASSPLLFSIIKYAGALYILYIGWQIARAAPLELDGNQQQMPLRQIFRQTVLMNILNPKVALFFLAFLPQFVDTASEHATAHFIFFGFLFQICSLFVMASVGIFAGSISSALRQNEFAGLYINRIVGTIVMLLGAAIPAKEIWDFVSEN
ncbi:MAG: hypothetical protein COB93_06265 [Sneathiella sp.]|nr:MAG: hypothetical protein COB93_06265 [Sneathiella sp.]